MIAYTQPSRKSWSRANPKPFEVVCPTFEFFYNINKDLVYESIRHGRKLNESTVTDIWALKYERGEIQYKLSFDDNFFKSLPQHPKKAIMNNEEFQRLHTGKLPITQKKYTHLQETKKNFIKIIGHFMIICYINSWKTIFSF